MPTSCASARLLSVPLKPLQIVCGAANVRVGMRVPAALIGATLPGGMAIKKAKLRGVESSGMLCSAKELGIAEDAEGLLELPAMPCPVPMYASYLQLDDHSIEVDLTPNRGDCLGLAGIAREIGVLNRCAVKTPDIAAVTATLSDEFPMSMCRRRQACPRYLGRVIRGLTGAAQTPLWMKERLRRSGMRSLGPLVDVTNYVLLELGQPMHAFDLSRVQGSVCVRWAKAEEKITLLDGKAITLDAQTLVIADDNGAQALAGVMGGMDTAVSTSTDSVFLECAFFAPDAIAGRARRYGLQTDSAYRFERGVDPDMQYRAMERATGLLISIAGGQAGPIIDHTSAAALPVRQSITLRRARIGRLLGMALPDAEITEVLALLGMAVESHVDGWRITPPGFRFDIALEADLIEELARVHGYNRLPSSYTRSELIVSPQPESALNLDRARQLLVDRGYQEIVTYSFVDPLLQRQLDPERDPIGLANPLSSELSVMRTQLWPGLVKTLIHNQNRQQAAGRYFEIGLNYIKQDNDIIQDKYIGCLISGAAYPEQWGAPPRAADFFDIKADAEQLLNLMIDPGNYEFQPVLHPALHPGQAARIVSNGSFTGTDRRAAPGSGAAVGLIRTDPIAGVEPVTHTGQSAAAFQ